MALPWGKKNCFEKAKSYTVIMETSEHIRKSHNISLIMYHFVFPTKYRRIVLDKKIDNYFRVVCLEIELRYDIHFLEIGLDGDHVYFLIQGIPSLSPTEIVTMLKSILSKRIFKTFPHVKKKLWGGKFWGSGYYVNTVGQYGNEEVIRKYVQNQGKEKEYKQLHKGIINKNQLSLI